MPMPRFVARLNKRWTNKRVLREGNWAVLTHRGRSSGNTYQTPIEAHRVDDGFIFIPTYGSKSDWMQNVLKSGNALLETPDGTTFDLVSPRLIAREEARGILPEDSKPPPRILRISEYLRMDTKSPAQSS